MTVNSDAFLTSVLAALSLGIAAVFSGILPQNTALFAAVAVFFGVAVFGAVICHAGNRLTIPAVLIFFLALGILRGTAAFDLSPMDISHRAGQEVTVEGTVDGEVRRSTASDGSTKLRYVVAADRVRGTDGSVSPVSGKLVIYARVKEGDHVKTARIGDRVRATGEIRLPHGYQNPGQIDTALLLRTDGITATLSTGKSGVDIAPVENTAVLERFAADVRAHYRQSMENVMPKEDAAAIFAMLFGGYEGIKEELLESFTVTGIVHILSVSGSHVSLLAAVTALLCRLFHLPARASAGLVIAVIAFYCVLAGLVPPVIRSGIMGGLAFLAFALGRENDSRRLLILTGFFMLLWQPLLLGHISFQLSFLATAGLLFLGPSLRNWFCRLKMPDVLAAGFAVTTAAQLATLPVLAWYFNQLSISSLLANLIVVPIVEGMIIIGLFGGIAAFLLPPLGMIVFLADSLLLGLVSEMTRVLAALPYSQVQIPTPGLVSSVLFYVLLSFPLWPEERRQQCFDLTRKYRSMFVGVSLCCVFVFTVISLLRPPQLTVHFIDVGQGDAALVVTPKGHAFLFDTGGTRDGFDIGGRVTVPYLRHYGVRSLDAIFLTHAHEDHAAGCGAVLRQMPVGRVVTAAEDRSDYARSMRLGEGDPLVQKLTRGRAGDVWEIDGVRIEILYGPDKPEGVDLTGNEVSNVYRVTYGRASFLFTGDLVKEQEQAMLDAGIDVSSTVLKVGHHGSNTSTGDPFLRQVAPSYAVFCVGRDNGFGHPKADVVSRCRSAGARILRTDRDGAVVFSTDGVHLAVQSFAL